MFGYDHTMVKNAINEDCFAGGSSAGSAVSVKAF
jgi:Asp-tRNA(Asn)/Glu-tRNA(Gln) amidotransferase A subunit family amidase